MSRGDVLVTIAGRCKLEERTKNAGYGYLTFVPSTTLVVVSHYLRKEKLCESLIMWDARQHFTEFSNNRHKLDRTLRVQMLAIFKKPCGIVITLKTGRGETPDQ